MTKRHQQLKAQHTEHVRRRTELTEEGNVISATCEREERLQRADETARLEAILGELDELKPKVDALEAEMAREKRLEEHERGTIRGLRDSGDALAAPPEFESFGEQLQAMVYASDPQLWGPRFGSAKSQGLETKLNTYRQYYAAATGMSAGVGPEGGYLIRKDWSGAMLDRARQQSKVFARMRQIPISSDSDTLEFPMIDETSRATGSRWGGVQMYWLAEAATKTASKPKLFKGELKLEEIAGLFYATDRLLRDAAALEAIVSAAFESELAFMLDDAVIRGDGVGKPLGFFSPGTALVSVAKEVNQVADTVVAANVLKMYAAMPPDLITDAAWFINNEVMAQLPQMAIGQQPVWLPPSGLAGNPAGGTLLGRPVYIIEQAEKLGDKGDILFVATSQYVTIVKSGEGLRYDTSMHVRFINNETAFRWVYRTNGQPAWKSALTPYKGTTNISPFISLDDRA